MIGGNLLLDLLGHRLHAVRIQSCWQSGEQTNPCHALYLKFGYWLWVQSDSMRTEILQVETPELVSFDPQGEDVQYPTTDLSEERVAAIGQRLAAISELMWHGDRFGVLLDFDAGAVVGIESGFPDPEAAEMRSTYFDSRSILPPELIEVPVKSAY